MYLAIIYRSPCIDAVTGERLLLTHLAYAQDVASLIKDNFYNIAEYLGIVAAKSNAVSAKGKSFALASMKNTSIFFAQRFDRRAVTREHAAQWKRICLQGNPPSGMSLSQFRCSAYTPPFRPLRDSVVDTFCLPFPLFELLPPTPLHNPAANNRLANSQS